MLMIKGLTKCVERLLMFVLTLPQHYTTEMLMMMNGSSSQLRLQRYELFLSEIFLCYPDNLGHPALRPAE